MILFISFLPTFCTYIPCKLDSSLSAFLLYVVKMLEVSNHFDQWHYVVNISKMTSDYVKITKSVVFKIIYYTFLQEIYYI